MNWSVLIYINFCCFDLLLQEELHISRKDFMGERCTKMGFGGRRVWWVKGRDLRCHFTPHCRKLSIEKSCWKVIKIFAHTYLTCGMIISPTWTSVTFKIQFLFESWLLVWLLWSCTQNLLKQKSYYPNLSCSQCFKFCISSSSFFTTFVSQRHHQFTYNHLGS